MGKNTDTDNIAQRRAAIVDALNAAAATFTAFGEERFEDVMKNGLSHIADAVGVDRVVVYTSDADDTDGPGLRIVQVYRWNRADGAALTAPAERLTGIFKDIWAPSLMRNECIVKRQGGGASGEERELMDAFGIRSFALVPVFTHGEFWGAVALLKLSDGPDFSDGCLDLIRFAALLCANTVIREGVNRKFKESFEALERGKKMTDTLNRAAVSFLSDIGRDFGEMMTAAMSRIAEALALDRLSVWRNFTAPDATLHTSQIYRWDKVLGGTTEPTEGLKDVTYAALAPRWEELLRSGESINGPVKDLPEAEMLTAFGVVSAYITPIHVSGKFWGFVLFEDRVRERCFERDCVETMRSATFLCANAVMRTEMERDLKDALGRATAASEAKGNFLSNMSHEMRTPLNTIMGMSSIGRNAPDLERKNYALGKIEEASSHLLGVINDVLDMSKIEAGKLELVPVDFSFENMLKKAVNAVCFRMEQKQQSFQVSVDGRIPPALWGDDQRLAQVIINLLSNAVKFTPEGGSIRLDTSLEEEGEDGVCAVSVEVSDTGIGMTPEQQARLFHTFEQADGGISRKFGGTGLGLAISKRIVEMMGGEIGVASREGAGSIFRFTFRAARGKDARKTALDPSVNWGTVKVLAVDDALDTQSYFSEIFKRYGVSCDVARSGAEALRRIEEAGGYDIYFVDWKMPGMDGIELTRRIRESGAGKQGVVIMISAADWALIRGDAEVAGVNRHLMKPLFASDIMDCMNSCLGVGGSNTPQQRSAVKGGELKGCNILLAEDVEINREILIASLEDTDVSIDCAENGLRVLRMLSENPGKYDLIFMDVQMPEMDGLEATRKIRESGSKIPIIAMTANVFKEDIEMCMAAGMDDHLGKPLDIGKVIKKVRKYWVKSK